MMRSFTFFLFILLIAIAAAHAAKDGATVGGSGSESNTEITIKGLGFYRHFGTNLNRNKFNTALECDYDHPDKAGFCPPMGDVHPFVANKGPEEQNRRD